MNKFYPDLSIKKFQDTQLCVNSQERHVAHKCYLQEPLSHHF